MPRRQEARRLISRFECRNRRSCGRHHLEFIDYLNRPPYIQGAWSELGLDVNVTLLSDLIFCDDVQVSERLMHKCRHVRGLLQNLCILVVIDESEQFIENSLDIRYFFEVASNH